MKQTIYLIRHAEPNYNNHQDDERELTAEGLQDCQLLLDYFKDISIDRIYSSPFKRALQTIDELAKEKNLPIQIKENFRERKIDDVWIDDFNTFSQRQWQDFNYKLARSTRSKYPTTARDTKGTRNFYHYLFARNSHLYYSQLL